MVPYTAKLSTFAVFVVFSVDRESFPHEITCTNSVSTQTVLVLAGMEVYSALG